MAKIKSQKSKVKSSNQNSKLLDGLDLPEYRVELKNINSFRFCRRALEFEIYRQTEMLESGKTPTQETRGWNEIKNLTFPQRSKEEAHDYRYFPEPDIPPIRITNQELGIIKNQIPELPDARIARFINDYELTEYQANILADDVDNEFEKKLHEHKDFSPVEVANALINKRQLVKNSSSVVDEKELKKIIQKILIENPKVVADFKNGKTQVLGVLIGKVVGIFGADARLVKSFLEIGRASCRERV